MSRLRFLSTPSARRATSQRSEWQSCPEYFYPRPPRGGRLRVHAPGEQHIDHFYPRPPRGGRQTSGSSSINSPKFLSTPSARRATISLHIKSQQERISIHALREEGDLLRGRVKCCGGRFLSTPSARRATRSMHGKSSSAFRFLSTPSARRATNLP